MHEHGLAGPGLDGGDRLGAGVVEHVGHDDVGPLLGEALAAGTADAVAAAGDDRDLAFQPHANSGITCFPISSIDCMTFSWGIL